MSGQKFEVDDETGQTVLLRFRDAQGIEWTAAALLSPLGRAGGTLSRRIEPGEELKLLSIQLVIR